MKQVEEIWMRRARAAAIMLTDNPFSGSTLENPVRVSADGGSFKNPYRTTALNIWVIHSHRASQPNGRHQHLNYQCSWITFPGYTGTVMSDRDWSPPVQAEAQKHLKLRWASIADTMTKPMVEEPRSYHVRNHILKSDRILTTHRYGDVADRWLTPAPEAATRAHPYKDKGDRHGQSCFFVPVLTDISDELDALSAESGPFRGCFGVDIETRV